MSSTLKRIFLLWLSVLSLNATAQVDMDNIPKNIQKAISDTEKNGGCSFFDYSIDNIDVINPNCAGEETGEACVDLSSITPAGAYTVIWSGPDGHPEDGAMTPCITGLGAGTWVAAVFNAANEGCVVVVEITEPAAMTILNWGIEGVTLIPPSCYGQCDGLASPLVFGGPGDGTGPFEYLYDNGDTTAASSNLCDPFTLTITDSNGCFREFDYDFEDGPLEVQVDSSITNTCFGEATGSIELSVSGGNPIPVVEYLYSWSSVPLGVFSTNQNIYDLAPGTYSVDITDGSPCTITKQYVIEESEEIILDPIVSELLCYGDVNGEINPNASGGISPLSYSWIGDNVQINNSTQDNLPSGDFNVIVTDSIGCSVSEDFTLAAPDSIAITGIINSVDCFGEANGSIILDVNGGASPYESYSWDVPACYTGPTDVENLTNLCGGVYEVTVIDTDNCSMNATFEVMEPDEIVLELTTSDVTCFGANDGYITLNILGGATPMTTPSWFTPPFTIDGNGISDLDPGMYTVEYTDGNNCFATESVEIFGAAEISVTETIVNASCSNIPDGSITIEIFDAILPNNFIRWENELGEEIGNTENISDLLAGDYTVFIEDGNGCEYVNTYTVDAPEEIIITLENVTPVLCFGNNDGAIDISVTGGNGLFQYTWSGTPMNPAPNNQEDVSELLAGTYTVVAQSGSCISSEIVTIDPATEIELSFDVTPISCPGIDDGAIDMTVVGGMNPPQNIVWSGPTCFTGANTEDINGLCPGTYFVLFTDANGCEQSGSVTLDPATELVVESVIDDVDCYDGSSGSIDITLFGATGIPTFDWDGPDPFPGANTEDISGLIFGDYNVEVTIDGCVTTESFTVMENDSIYIDEVIVPFPCNGNVLGSIDITPHGGVGPYTFLWTGTGIDIANNQNEDQFDLIAGTYLVIVTDSLGCFIQKEYNIAPTTNIDINGIVSDVSCFGLDDGAISTSPSGGQDPYSYQWLGPNLYTNNVQQNVTDLLPGDYDLTVTDQDGCVVDTIMTINEPVEIVINVTSTDPTCGDNNGTITINTTGGAGITTVSVTKDGVTVTDLNNLSAGLYIVTAQDSNGCVSTENVTLSNSEIEITGVATDINCFGNNDGAISITINGAVGTPVVSWVGEGPIDNPNGTTISNLIAGEYVVTVSDDNGCIASEIFTIDENEEIIVAVDIVNVFCESDIDGSITIINSIGGQGDYTFIWNSDIHTNFEAEEIDNLPPGLYELTVTDGLGCSMMFNYEVMSATSIEVLADITNVDCFGENTGLIDITVSGGIPSYDYDWNGFGTNQDITDLFSGEYFLNISDENGCEKDTSFVVDSSTEIYSDADVVHVSCNGDATGSITLVDLGGSPSYNFNWSSSGYSSTNQNISMLSAGVYNLNIIDSLNCQFDTTFTIQETNVITAESEIMHVTCFGDNTGSITLTNVEGGVGVITTTWNPVPTGATIISDGIINLPSGDYTLTLEDENACTYTESYTIQNLNDDITITADITNVFCAGQNNGVIEIDIQGGVPGYEVSWLEVASTSTFINELAPGTYNVSITDNLGCTKDSLFVVNETNPLVLDLISIENNLCAGDTVGLIDINVLGGSPEYNYTWTDGDGFYETTQDIMNLDGGIYNVHVEDFNLCELDQEFTIEEPSELLFDLEIVNSNCGLDDGTAEVLNISGGTISTTYNVNWYTAASVVIGTGTSINDLAPGEYAVVIIDDNDCMITETFSISDNTGELASLITPISCFGSDDGAITVSITGMTRPLIFEWSSDLGYVSFDSTITDLTSDNYTITVTDALDCQIVESYILTNPSQIEVDSFIGHESCPGENDGAIDLVVSGGSGGYTYLWSGLGIINPQDEDQTNLPPGNYPVTITDDNLCSNSFDFTINQASEFDVIADVNSISCFGIDDGSIILTIDFDIFPPIDNLTFNWEGTNVIPDSKDQFNLGPGVYNLTVSTPSGCQYVSSYTIDDAIEILIDINTINSTCLMDNGSASIDASGGVVVADYIYSWFEGSGNEIVELTNTLGSVGAGLYSVIVTDDNSCSVEQNFVISDDGGELTYVVDSVSCPGLSDGSIDITYSGLNETVAILWSGPDGGYDPTTEDISELLAGEYTVLLTSADGCILGDVIPVGEKDFINNSVIINDVSCFGLNDGAIDITVDGGTPSYTFDWIGPSGSITSDINGNVEDLVEGDYSVLITDSEGCVGSGNFSIIEPEEISIIYSVDNATCFGLNDGEINIVNVDGGSGVYTFSWTKTGDIDFESESQIINGLTEGSYNLTIADSNGCTFMDSFEITNNSQISLEITTNDASCGLPTGTATVFASGGTNSFTYEWFDGDGFLLSEDSQNINDLVQGSYSVTVTDENGCYESQDFSIQNADYSVTASIDHINCFGNNEGLIEVTLSPDFDFPITGLNWSGSGLSDDPPPTDLIITDLIAGVYTLSLADVNGCPFTDDYEVLQPDSISISSIVGDIGCFGESTGSIVVSATGGTPSEILDPAYTYEWIVPAGVTNPGNTHFSESLPTGNYSISVTDSLSCVNDINIELTQPSALSLIAAVSSPVCESDLDGVIQVIVSGGTEGVGGYVYQWSNDETVDIIENLAVGEYSVNITDENECQLDSSFVITANIIIDLEYGLDNVSCYNLGDGAIDLTASGGSEDFVFNWNGETDDMVDNITTEDLINLTGGEYYLTLTDTVNGCVKMDTLFIINPDSLYANTIFENPLCFGDSTGRINVETLGGTNPYEFNWTSSDPEFSQTTDSIENLFAGTYQLEISDSSNCIKTYDFVLTEPEALLIEVNNVENAFCYTSADGSISTSISGGIPNYNVDWINDSGLEFEGNDINGLIAGNYYLNITDSNNCIVQDTVLLNYDEEIIAVIQDQDPACDQLQVTLDGTESIGASSYNWMDNNDQTISDLEFADITLGLSYNEFILEVSNGVCLHSDTLSLIVNPLPSIDAGDDVDAFPDEIIEVGGNPTGPTAISFNWQPGELLSDSTVANPTYLNLGTQQFYLNIIDGNGCQNRDSILITLINEVIIPDGFSPNADGKNDTWVITNSDKFPDMVVKVFSRWGDLLFESKGYNTPWDGKYENGFVPVGTYYYVIELKDPLFPKPFTGPLTIFR